MKVFKSANQNEPTRQTDRQVKTISFRFTGIITETRMDNFLEKAIKLKGMES